MPWRHVLGKLDVRGKQRPPLWGRAVEAEGCAGMSQEASGDSPFLPAITSSSSIKKWSPDAILARGEWPPLFSGHDSQLRKAECEKAVPAPARIVVGRPSSQPGSSRRPRLLLGAPVCFPGSCKGGSMVGAASSRKSTLCPQAAGGSSLQTGLVRVPAAQAQCRPSSNSTSLALNSPF